MFNCGRFIRELIVPMYCSDYLGSLEVRKNFQSPNCNLKEQGGLELSHT